MEGMRSTCPLIKTLWRRCRFLISPWAISISLRCFWKTGWRIQVPRSLWTLRRPALTAGEIDDATGHVTSLKFKAAAQAQYIPLVVSVTPATTNAELSQLIADEIKKRGASNIYRFRIRGMRDPDTEFDPELLAGQWNISEILDETEPQYDFHALFADHPSDMIGFYIQALMKENMSPVEKKALYYGIHALLMTKDERS